MIFRRAFIQEMTAIASAVFVVLLLLMMVTQVLKLLSQATVGLLASSAVWTMMGFAVVRYFPILLSLTLFIAVLITLTRFYKDHEMVIWFTSGQSIRAFIRPVLEFAMIPILLIALLSMALSPWALRKSQEFRKIAQQKETVTRVAAGVFRSSGNLVYFSENLSGVSSEVKNIFVQQKQGDAINVIVAQKGRVLNKSEKKTLSLENGYEYQGIPGQANYMISHFKEAFMPINLTQYALDARNAQTKNMMELFQNARAEEWAELQARLSLPLSTLLLVLMAIPLAYYHVRRAGFAHLLGALFVFFLYQNLNNIFQTWIEEGKLIGWVGMWPLHVGVAIVVWGLFRWRERVK